MIGQEHSPRKNQPGVRSPAVASPKKPRDATRARAPRCGKFLLAADAAGLVDGLCRLLAAMLLHTFELRLMRTGSC